jgi:predicted nucleic acid-binding protein
MRGVATFFDTSTLVAAFWGGHPQHSRSFERFAGATRANTACALHTLAELYSTMTALPVKPPISPEQALLFVEEVRQRCALVRLDEEEYLDVLQRAADRNLTGGRIYDALILRCAEKARSKAVVTWNVKHFQAIAPHLAERIQTP